MTHGNKSKSETEKPTVSATLTYGNAANEEVGPGLYGFTASGDGHEKSTEFDVYSAEVGKVIFSDNNEDVTRKTIYRTARPGLYYTTYGYKTEKTSSTNSADYIPGYPVWIGDRNSPDEDTVSHGGRFSYSSVEHLAAMTLPLVDVFLSLPPVNYHVNVADGTGASKATNIGIYPDTMFRYRKNFDAAVTPPRIPTPFGQIHFKKAEVGIKHEYRHQWKNSTSKLDVELHHTARVHLRYRVETGDNRLCWKPLPKVEVGLFVAFEGMGDGGFDFEFVVPRGQSQPSGTMVPYGSGQLRLSGGLYVDILSGFAEVKGGLRGTGYARFEFRDQKPQAVLGHNGVEAFARVKLAWGVFMRDVSQQIIAPGELIRLGDGK